MSTFKRFEEITAWKRARIVTNKTYCFCEKPGFNRDRNLQNQITRASVSIMANIAEGHGRRTPKDFAKYLGIARASALEAQSHLYVALDRKYIDKEEFNDTYFDLDEISKMTISLARYLRGI